MDYALAAEKMTEVAEVCLQRLGVEPGMEVLDVACGTGNATIPAARAGARVTGLDPSPDLLAIARERAADAMVEVDWVEGNPRELPFEDRSFDRVTSMFGNPSIDEMRRVSRGRIAICCWTPDGPIGRALGIVPDAALGGGVFERHAVEWRGTSVEHFADFMLESVGRAPVELRERLVRGLAAENLEEDGTLRFQGEYLLSVI